MNFSPAPIAHIHKHTRPARWNRKLVWFYFKCHEIYPILRIKYLLIADDENDDNIFNLHEYKFKKLSFTSD